MSEKDPILNWIEEPTSENLKEAADEYSMEEIAEYREKFEALYSIAEGYNENRVSELEVTIEEAEHVHNYWIDVDDEMNVFQDLEDVYSELVD